MKLYIVISLLLIPYSVFCQQNNSAYYFKTSNEGIYKMYNPFDSADTVFITNKNVTYIPYFDSLENCFYAYGEKESVYQLRKGTAPLKMMFPQKTNIHNESIYKYNLLSTTGNWLHAIIEEDKEYRDTIYSGIPINQLDDTLQCYLYNFSETPINIDITINGVLQNVNLPTHGENKITLNYKNANGITQLVLYSAFNPVGILKYEYNRKNRALNPYKDFNMILVDYNYNYANNIYPSYSYFTFDKGKLKKMDIQQKKNKLTNLLIQKNNTILTVNLNLCQTADFTKSDYLILTSKDFLNDIPNVIRTINTPSSSLKFNVVDVQSIYDLFSFSESSAEAIKTYLHLLHPTYVLFIGDANDKKNASNNFVPTFYFNQHVQNSRIASDYMYTYATDISMPDFALGRIPVSNTQELKAYLDKLDAYVKSHNTNPSIILDDKHVLQEGNINQRFKIHKERKHNFLYNLFYNDFMEEINSQKPAMLVHIGHGSFSGWETDAKTEFEEFNSIKKGLLFNVIDLSCWTGEFANTHSNSFSENLLKLNQKGSVNTICYSGFSATVSYPFIFDYFKSNLNNYDAGTLLNKMKQELYARGKMSFDDILSLNLLGIPSLKMCQ